VSHWTCADSFQYHLEATTHDRDVVLVVEQFTNYVLGALSLYSNLQLMDLDLLGTLPSVPSDSLRYLLFKLLSGSMSGPHFLHNSHHDCFPLRHLGKVHSCSLTCDFLCLKVTRVAQKIGHLSRFLATILQDMGNNAMAFFSLLSYYTVDF
jgi:hypothetical protein